MNAIKGMLGVAGGAVFLVAGVFVALSARKYQLSGALMPNGKGGFMSFRDGYLMSFSLIAMAAGWIFFSYRAARRPIASKERESSANEN